MLQTIVLASFLFIGPNEQKGPVPEILARSISRRMSFETAYFKYDQFKRANLTNAMIQSRFETRMSREGTYWHDMGDSNGVLLRDFNNGQPILNVGYACSPKHTVRCRESGDEWFRHDGEQMLRACKAELSPDQFDLADPRSFGLSVKDLRDTSPAQFLEKLQSLSGRWSQREKDGKIEVTLTNGSPDEEHSELIYVIDPNKDDAIIAIHGYVVQPDGSRKAYVTTTNEYKRMGNRWWLSKSEYHMHPGHTFETVVVHHAEFDRPDHPKIKNADVLKVPAGVRLADFRVPPDGQSRKLDRYLGNGEVVSDEQWQQIKDQYDLAAVEKWEKEQRAIGIGTFPKWWNADDSTFGLEGVAHTPDLWEAYVRRWILKFNHDTVSAVSLSQQSAKSALSAAQIESAWAIYRDCRKQAEPIVKRMKEEAEAARATDAKRAADANRAGETSSPSTDRPAEPKPNRHERRLAEIFDTLKKRLNTLLLTKQASELKARE